MGESRPYRQSGTRRVTNGRHRGTYFVDVRVDTASFFLKCTASPSVRHPTPPPPFLSFFSISGSPLDPFLWVDVSFCLTRSLAISERLSLVLCLVSLRLSLFICRSPLLPLNPSPAARHYVQHLSMKVTPGTLLTPGLREPLFRVVWYPSPPWFWNSKQK